MSSVCHDHFRLQVRLNCQRGGLKYCNNETLLTSNKRSINLDIRVLPVRGLPPERVAGVGLQPSQGEDLVTLDKDRIFPRRILPPGLELLPLDVHEVTPRDVRELDLDGGRGDLQQLDVLPVPGLGADVGDLDDGRGLRGLHSLLPAHPEHAALVTSWVRPLSTQRGILKSVQVQCQVFII